MRVASQRIASALAALGFRARILIVLILAGVPGVVFGAAEGLRSFELSTARALESARAVGQREANRLDQSLDGATHVLTAIANLDSLRESGASCTRTLSSVVRSVERYGVAQRVDRDGRLICMSDGGVGSDVGRPPWFTELQRGARFSVSSLETAASAERVLQIAAATTEQGRFSGALVLSMRREWLAELLRQDLGAHVDRVTVFDRAGNLVASVDADARRASRLDGGNTLETWTAGGALRVVVYPRSHRGALMHTLWVASSPVLIIGLTALVVGIALEAWVMTWFRRLHAHVERGVDDPPSDLSGAPPEFQDLGDALNRTMQNAHNRQEELKEAVDSNRQLTRDLHHRVKNNLQVLVSLISRAQKRAPNEASRAAAAEIRCRVLSIALVHRYLDPPEHLGVIDLDSYIAELARQSHAALFSEGRRARLLMQIDPVDAPVARATSIGLILVEVMIAGARHSGADPTVNVRWSGSEDGTAEFLIDINGPHMGEIQMDDQLIAQMARQAGGAAVIGPGARVNIAFQEPEAMPAAAASAG